MKQPASHRQPASRPIDACQSDVPWLKSIFAATACESNITVFQVFTISSSLQLLEMMTTVTALMIMPMSAAMHIFRDIQSGITCMRSGDAGVKINMSTQRFLNGNSSVAPSGTHVGRQPAVASGIRIWWLRELVMCPSGVVSGD